MAGACSGIGTRQESFAHALVRLSIVRLVRSRSDKHSNRKTRNYLFELANHNKSKWRVHAWTLKDRRPFEIFDNELTRPDGERLVVNVSGKPVLSAVGQFQGYRGVTQDVTQQRTLSLQRRVGSVYALIFLFGERLVELVQVAETLAELT